VTSNSVRTFDEVFKSRIQLSLRFDPLGESQRLRIWEAFLNQLEPKEFQWSNEYSPHDEINRGVVVDDVRENLAKLAKVEMNGREIRNAVSTARQLVLFRMSVVGGFVSLRVIS
jgi:hypothetical protein